MSAKRLPLRTCAGCNAKVPKHELVRLVRGQTGSVQVDARGNQPGRGVYLCRRTLCWETGLRKGRVGYALGINTSSMVRSELIKQSVDWTEVKNPRRTNA